MELNAKMYGTTAKSAFGVKIANLLHVFLGSLNVASEKTLLNIVLIAQDGICSGEIVVIVVMRCSEHCGNTVRDK